MAASMPLGCRLYPCSCENRDQQIAPERGRRSRLRKLLEPARTIRRSPARCRGDSRAPSLTLSHYRQSIGQARVITRSRCRCRSESRASRTSRLARGRGLLALRHDRHNLGAIGRDIVMVGCDRTEFDLQNGHQCPRLKLTTTGPFAVRSSRLTARRISSAA